MKLIPQKVVLIIMDGWGEAPASASNAIAAARTPFVDSLYQNYPHSHLLTSGEDVGLPAGQMGNSEVGHLNIGAGRVVYQELLLINKAISSGSIANNSVVQKTIVYCVENNKPLHLIGLVSDGGVHSHIDHLVYLCKLAHAKGVEEIFIHVFTDGRDTDPHAATNYIKDLESRVKDTGAKIATVIGRYYAMDRDKRWSRVKKAYDLLVTSKGDRFNSATEAIESSYKNGITDEFIEPSVITSNGSPVANIEDGDAVICFNFRTDRCREITEVLTQHDMPSEGMSCLKLYYVTLTNYDSTYKNVKIVFDKENISDTLGEVISRAGYNQIRIAETEKYPHVTFFFSGGRESEFEGETRIMVPSPKVATYDLQPSMSAFEVKDKLVTELLKGEVEFVCLNFANADMVGHTGSFKAAVKALETVDKCVEEVVEAGLKKGYSFLITADHGNADYMINADGSANTAHTKNPVPLFLISHANPGLVLKNGRLADIAPSILTIMGLKIPEAMTGENLIEAIKANE